MVLLHLMRLLALASSCATFGLVTHAGGLYGGVGTWCVFCWTFSFTGTLFILIVDICIKEHIQSFWANFMVTFSSYAALLCFLTSIIFPFFFLKGEQEYHIYNQRIIAEVFSCLATLAYLLEVWMAWVEARCFMATTHGLLLVCQTFVGGIIFFFISNPVLYTDQVAVRWCMAVYCMCFIWSAASILRCISCSINMQRCLNTLNFCAAIMYLSAAIIWPVFKFNRHYPTQTFPPDSCQEVLQLCPWGKSIVVTMLTALNCLLYLLSACSFCMSGSEEQYSLIPSTSVLRFNRLIVTRTQPRRIGSSRRPLLQNGRRNCNYHGV